MEDLDLFWNEHESEYIKDLSDYISFHSVAKPTGNPDAPFGEENKRMLGFASSLFKRYGLDSCVIGNAFTEGLLKGLNGDKTIAIACHGDVVPAEGEWDKDPFKLYRKEDHLVGRGTTDNKGAMIAVLYALRYLKKNNIKLRNNIKILVGSAEEIGMDDYPIAYPEGTGNDLTLVPDSGFPLCYGEKSSLRISLDCKVKNIISINGGSGVGVIDRAEAKLQSVDDLQDTDDIIIDRSNNTVTAIGKGRHAATPEGGEDALIKLLKYLDDNKKLEDEDDLRLIMKSFPDFYGTGLGLDTEDQESGRLTMVLTKAETEDNHVRFTVSSRLPFSLDPAEVGKEVQKKLPFSRIEKSSYGFHREVTPLLERINSIANEEYGTAMQPYIMAGGTYARVMPNAYPFGMGSPGGNKMPPFPQGQGRAHQRNESVHLERMRKGFKIYVKSLMEIDKEL